MGTPSLLLLNTCQDRFPPGTCPPHPPPRAGALSTWGSGERSPDWLARCSLDRVAPRAGQGRGGQVAGRASRPEQGWPSGSCGHPWGSLAGAQGLGEALAGFTSQACDRVGEAASGRAFPLPRQQRAAQGPPGLLREKAVPIQFLGLTLGWSRGEHGGGHTANTGPRGAAWGGGEPHGTLGSRNYWKQLWRYRGPLCM